MTIKNIGNRGIALGIVLLTAIVFTITAAGLMSLVLGTGQRTKILYSDRLKARYAAEAGMVYAMAKLAVHEAGCRVGNPASCYPQACCAAGCANKAKTDASFLVDIDGDGTAETPVCITVTQCGPGLPHTLSTKVCYPDPNGCGADWGTWCS